MKTEKEIRMFAKSILSNNIDGLRELINDDDLFYFYKGVVIEYGIGIIELMQEQHKPKEIQEIELLVCNYCLEWKNELPDGYYCAKCIENYNYQLPLCK